MNKYFILAFLYGSAFLGYGQMILSSGSDLVVNSGSVVVVNDITNNGGTITNSGEVSVLGDITNNTTRLFNSSSSGTITFEGSSGQIITGDNDVGFYGTLDINNSSGVSITDASTGTDQTINGTLNFTSGLLTINGFDLTIGSTDPTGAGASSFIVTNGAGQVKRTVAASDVLFPVGNSDYNPIILNNSGTSDTYGVQDNDSKPASFSGTTHIVNGSWDITETVSGNSNLTVTIQWNSGEEATAFDRSKSCVGITSDAGTNVSWGTTGAASGSNPYVRSQSGYTSVGTFMVGDYFYGGIIIDLKVFLAAAYNATNDNMDKTLNTESLLPLTDPYSQSTTVSSIPTNAVDWIKIELRDGGDNTNVLHTFARFIDQDGQVIEEDESNFNMKGVASGSYYIAIHHRNHFGIISNSTVDLSGTPTISFESAQATAYQDGTISTNAAMKEVETDVFALWEGDASGDGTVAYNGAGNDRSAVLTQVGISTPGNTVTDTYDADDVNMDGDVIYNGAGSDRSSILTVVGVSTPGVVFTEHIPE